MDSREKQKAGEGQTLWLTDRQGNSYLARREAIEAYRVPSEHIEDAKGFLEDEVEGYGEGNWLIKGVLDHMGLKLGDDKFDPNFDLDSNGVTDWDDYQIAKKHWYDQYGSKNVPPATS